MCSNLAALDNEGVLVISVNEQSPQHTIQKILAVETLPNPVVEVEDFIQGYEWTVDNKYYSATVILYALTEKKILDTKLCNKIRATIFCFDGREDSSFEDILSWMPLLKNISSEIQLLICDSCDVTLRKKILKWSIENEFELIELNPSEESEDENDTVFSKSKGYGRVIEALQSNMWCNLVMKKDAKDQKEQKKEETGDLSNITSPSTEQNANDTDRKMSVDDEEVILENEWVQNVFAEEDPDEESFEALFAKFASLKERASHLYGPDRKKYAEKVAIAFWKAMGGEEDEIAGLDDDE